MRGEHRRRAADDLNRKGSSPHARGALPCLVEAALDAGIIPACAGSTCAMVHRSMMAGDHPRMRGEHYK